MKAIASDTGGLRTETEQLIVAQMDDDVSKHAGVRTVQHRIAHENGIHLARSVGRVLWLDSRS
jgi:hypothetical protein